MRIQLGNTTVLEPATANRGGAACQSVTNNTPLQAGPIAGSLLAQTTVTGATAAESRGGLGTLTVGAGALAGFPMPRKHSIA